ncbi:MAG: hypothetical protein ACKVSF_11100 [Alphaproteobacteria bacterium]
MNPHEFRAEIVDPALRLLDLHSPAASNLLLGTALVESNLVYRRQKGGGPALGLFQIEPTTFDDIYRRYLPRQTSWLGSVNTLLRPYDMPIEQLVDNDRFACAIARLKYRMARPPLPLADDIEGLAAYWRLHYNAGGKGTVERFVALYRARVT